MQAMINGDLVEKLGLSLNEKVYRLVSESPTEPGPQFSYLNTLSYVCVQAGATIMAGAALGENTPELQTHLQRIAKEAMARIRLEVNEIICQRLAEQRDKLLERNQQLVDELVTNYAKDPESAAPQPLST